MYHPYQSRGKEGERRGYSFQAPKGNKMLGCSVKIEERRAEKTLFKFFGCPKGVKDCPGEPEQPEEKGAGFFP